MANKSNYSRELRILAEEVVKELENDQLVTEFNPDGIATSLVRQWLTYDGTAAISLSNGFFYLSLARSPLGNLGCEFETTETNWQEILVNHWKIAPDDLAQTVHELNLRQSSTIETTEGKVLRWWVNPKQRKTAIDHTEPDGPGRSKNEIIYQIAYESLRASFGNSIPDKEYPILTNSILRQWERYDGHASVFTEKKGIVIKMESSPDGGWGVYKSPEIHGTRQRLEENFVPPNEVTDAIIALNLGHNYTYIGTDKNRYQIWADPHRRAFGRKTINVPKEEMGFPPLVCPACGGVLNMWTKEMTQQKCKLCGTVAKRN